MNPCISDRSSAGLEALHAQGVTCHRQPQLISWVHFLPVDCAADAHSVLMAPVESLSVPDTMPGAGDTTNSVIDLDRELGV